MKNISKILLAICVIIVFSAYALNEKPEVDWDMVAKIREEGFQHSQVMDIVGYMTDVLGARLTLSEDMKRAQIWAQNKMKEIGLVNTVIEPFMDYGVTWDNEYFSIHMLEPDYQPMVGLPLTHTPRTNGKITCSTIIVDLKTKKDLDGIRGKLSGKVVLSTPPAEIDLDRLAQAQRKTGGHLRGAWHPFQSLP